jgi:PST family polysaccharide transporter
MALKAKAARGVLWTLVEYGGGEGIAFLVFLVLARVISPGDFGLVSLALVFVSFIQLFLNQGFADAVIQRQEIEEDHYSTAFWTNIAIAAAFILVMVCCADRIAALFDQPELAPVLRWLSPLPLGTALVSIHQAVFKRHLDFANFAKRAIVGIGAGGIVGVSMALDGFGVWSLVGQQLTIAAVSVVVLWWACPWQPRLRFSPRCFREMAEFSANVMGSNLVAFIYKKADIALIGYFLGTHELGYYYLVQRLFLTMGLVTQSTIQAIVMPVLSRVQNDPARFREIFTRTVQLLNASWLPLILGAGLVASLLLPTVFGAKWQPSVPLLEIMALAGFVDPYTLYTGPALTAAGRPRSFLKLSLIQTLLALVAIPVATRFGLSGVAAAVVLVGAAMIPFHLAALRREAGIGPRRLLRGCAGGTAAAIVMAAAVLLLKATIAPALPPFAALALLVGGGALVYAAALVLLAPALTRQIIELVASALGRGRQPSEGRLEAA